jgi:hypothetical protein
VVQRQPRRVAKRKESHLPALQVKDKQGQWRTVIENVGIPLAAANVVADLTGKFLSANRECASLPTCASTGIRSSSTLRRKLSDAVDATRSVGRESALARLSLSSTRRRRQPLTYDYKQVLFTSPWKVMTGRYTREGDVRELVAATDDMFVISRPGDELSLSFAADKLPPLPRGMDANVSALRGWVQ